MVAYAIAVVPIVWVSRSIIIYRIVLSNFIFSFRNKLILILILPVYPQPILFQHSTQLPPYVRSLITPPKRHPPDSLPPLSRYLITSNFPPSHHSLPSTPNTSPGVHFDHSLINELFVFFTQKLFCQHFSLPHNMCTHPHVTSLAFPLPKFPTLPLFPSSTSLHLTTISFPQISRSQMHFSGEPQNIYSANVSPPHLPIFHLPPLF